MTQTFHGEAMTRSETRKSLVEGPIDAYEDALIAEIDAKYAPGDLPLEAYVDGTPETVATPRSRNWRNTRFVA